MLEGKYEGIRINIDKKSFWDPVCGELCHKEIGLWLKENFRIPWKKGEPYNLIMEHVRNNRFRITRKIQIKAKQKYHAVPTFLE